MLLNSSCLHVLDVNDPFEMLSLTVFNLIRELLGPSVSVIIGKESKNIACGKIVGGTKAVSYGLMYLVR